jgi:apolipoprotein N-acyltransferase
MATQKRALPLILASFALIGALAFGFHHQKTLAQADHGTISVSLVQANVSLERKHDMAYFETNVEEYLSLTNGIAGHPDLIIWPETVIQKWIATTIGSVYQSPYLPKLDRPTNLITGSLTFTPPNDAHNSALGIIPTGEVLAPYHKQILMPFGEYMPGASLFPWLKKLNENIADFSAGTGPVVFAMPLERDSSVPLKVGPLICYEDVVPSLSRDAVRQGATLLVSVSNDAWFGNSEAPDQHELIASFRAIENGRALLRSTNTGATGIIDPTGKKLGTLPWFSAGVLTREVPLMAIDTPYAHSSVGLFPLWMAWATLLLAVLPRRRISKL